MNAWEYDHFNRKVETIERLLLEIKKQGEHIMSQLDDLNAAIQAEDVQIQSLAPVVTKIDADIAALLAKIAAGGTLPDITAQIQAIQAHTSALVTAVGTLTADDTKANS